MANGLMVWHATYLLRSKHPSNIQLEKMTVTPSVDVTDRFFYGAAGAAELFTSILIDTSFKSQLHHTRKYFFLANGVSAVLYRGWDHNWDKR